MLIRLGPGYSFIMNNFFSFKVFKYSCKTDCFHPRYTRQIENILRQFEAVYQWADIFSALNKLRKTCNISMGGLLPRLHNQWGISHFQPLPPILYGTSYHIHYLIINCGHHSSAVSSAPTILRPQVRIPSTPSMLFQFVFDCDVKGRK